MKTSTPIRDIPVVILAGGRGMRLHELTESLPKPMAPIGGRPILWHIMRIYADQGFRRFILCLGYKGDTIKEYFMNLDWRGGDFTVRWEGGRRVVDLHAPMAEDWSITFADTGEAAETGARIKKIARYVKEDLFFATYGDGVSDIDLRALLDAHVRSGKTATLTALHPTSKFGTVEFSEDHEIQYFREKPLGEEWVSGGFFVFGRKVFDYLSEADGCVLEREPFDAIVRDHGFNVYKHEGFWRNMDTFKDWKALNDLCASGEPPWRRRAPRG